MAGSAKEDVRDAVYALLFADATLQAMGTTYAQEAPDGASLPYNVVNAIVETTDWSFGSRIREVLIAVDSYSLQKRDDEVGDMDNRICVLLDDVTLSVDNWTFITIDMESSTKTPDERLNRNRSIFRVKVQE